MRLKLSELFPFRGEQKEIHRFSFNKIEDVAFGVSAGARDTACDAGRCLGGGLADVS